MTLNEFIRGTFLVLLWLLLIGSGLCVALSATFALWQVSAIAAVVGIACLLVIISMKKTGKPETPTTDGSHSD